MNCGNGHRRNRRNDKDGNKESKQLKDYLALYFPGVRRGVKH